MYNAHMHFLSYGAQGYDDDGWGCVFRSFQNVQLATGRRVSSMPELLRRTGLKHGNWAEPAHFVHFIPHSHAALAGDVRPKFTSLAQYARRHMSIEHLRRHIVAQINAREAVFVLDDTASGFAIVLHNDKPCWVDPHYRRGARFVEFTDQLLSARGWLVLEVPFHTLHAQRPHHT